MQLSKRLQAVAKLVTPTHTMADIGTDHGYLPIYLITERIVERAIAMDVNEGPLDVAKANIAKYQCANKIETRRSDGVTALMANEAQTIVIAGMGGNLVIKILKEGAELLVSVPELILQPQSEITAVRKFLQENGYDIVAEEMVCEDGKYYPMMKVVHGDMPPYRETDFIYGPCLLKDKNPVLKQFLDKEKETLCKISQQISQQGSALTTGRQQEIKQEMCLNELARRSYE